MASLTLSERRLALMLAGWELATASGVPNAQTAAGLLVVAGSVTENMMENQRSFAVLQYATESKEPVGDGALLITRERIVFASPRAVESVFAPTTVNGIVVEVQHINNGTNAEEFAKFTAALPSSGPAAVSEKELGIQEGAFAPSFIAALRAESAQLIEAHQLLAMSVATLDAQGVECIKKAAALTTAALRRFVIPEFEERITSRPCTCADFSKAIGNRLANPTLIPGLEAMNVTHYAATLLPAQVQCGGAYHVAKPIKPDVASTPFTGDCDVFAYGVKHGGYTAYIARTLMLQSGCPEDIGELYSFVFNVSGKVIELLRPGVTFAAVHEQALAYARELSPELAQRLAPSFGFATGLLIAQGATTIGKSGVAVVAAGMAVVVRVALVDVPDSRAVAGASQTLSLLLGDTALVGEAGAELLTSKKRTVEEVLFREEEVATVESQQRDLRAITRFGQSETNPIAKEQQRQEKQARLIAQKHAEWKAAGGRVGEQRETEDMKVFELGRLAKGDVRSYESASDASLPHVGSGGFEVDRAKKTMWIPIHGTPTPFHIATVNRVEITSDATGYYLIITFFHTTETNVAFKANRSKIFVKDISYFAKSASKFDAFVAAVKDIKAKIAAEDAARKQRQGLAAVGKIQPLSGGPRLKSVKVRPAPAMGRNAPSSGDLEAHANGFRFVCIGMEPLSLMYDNIKHAIYQPSENDICVIFHITLKDPIMVGKKKTAEVQFVAEVVESSEGLVASRRTHEQELEAEQMERERIRRTNGAFFAFVNEAKRHMSNVEVQLPMRNFDFQGCHSRVMTRFKANDHVLWAVNDFPFFSASLADVELVALERVIPSGANFDMVLIPHYPYKAVTTITTIPMASLEAIKEWLGSSSMVFFESTTNAMWPTLLKTIREDAEFEPWGGEGWKTLIVDDEDEEDEETDDESWDSEGEEDEDDDDDDDSGSDWAEEVESSSAASGSDDESDDSSVMSWDAMEARAEAEDRGKNYSDSDDDRIKKKRTRK